MVGKIKRVAVLGLGTLGAQIACQAAASGYDVSAYDLDDGVFQRTMNTFLSIDQSKVRPSDIKISAWPEASKKIKMVSSLDEAVKNSDLVMEVIPEDLDLKLSVWREMDEAAPDNAILATNSSSMPVSKLEGATRRPQKCLNIHFYHLSFGQTMADIMGGTKTDSEVLAAGVNFVRSLGVVPLKVKKEILGFCFNRIWRAVKRETLHMWAGDYIDFMDVDRAWMIFTGGYWGPFGLMDGVGLDVVWDIEMVYYNESKKPDDHPPQALKKLLEKGHLGVKTGKGFYHYPEPEYRNKDFLRP
jgi:3-hydroxybutyryl-CoA dehydrogenase